MSSFRISIICLASLFGAQTSIAQQASYPTTQYSPFAMPQSSANVFSTTTPVIPDTMLPGIDDHSAMSPHSWSTPTTQWGETPSYPMGHSVGPRVEGQLSTTRQNQNQFPLAEPPGTSVLVSDPQSTNGTLSTPFKSAGFSPNFNARVNAQAASSHASSLQTNRYPLHQDGLNSTPVQSQTGYSQENSFSNHAQTFSQPNPTHPNLTGPISEPTITWHGQPTVTWQGQPNQAMPVWSNGQQLPTFYAPPMATAGSVYRPDLGHREPVPTQRYFGTRDDGETFDFEDKKKEYPPMSEILATGRYFGSAAILFDRPHFQDNTAFSTSSATFGESIAFDFDYEFAPFIRFGFESKYGPGIEFEYFQYDESSNQASFTATAGVTAELSTWMMGPSRWSRLAALNAGETLSAEHSIDIETFGVSFFKEVKLPISRINGRFGFQYVSIAQNLDATLTDSGGGVLGSLNSRSDLRAYGPRFTLEYYRPVGHTKLEFVTTVGGSVMFGQRDQFVANSLAADFSRVGADEFLTSVEFNSGLQYKHNVAENRAVYARLGVNYSTWMGGGSAVDPQGDFGLRGFSFAVGYNR